MADLGSVEGVDPRAVEVVLGPHLLPPVHAVETFRSK